jgi:hypothetical protein
MLLVRCEVTGRFRAKQTSSSELAEQRRLHGLEDYGSHIIVLLRPGGEGVGVRHD